ncbi:retrotransposon protein, putative, ty1-copia subclass [Tanacetum coccineum]
MDKLQRDGVLQLTHDESLEKCKSCIFRKMAPTVSREGASYFITFTDDFSRYGYVYLMKHKHEVFKTFKVFQNEVENQLSKKIKAIRLDHGGEYLSHEFVNYMKSCGIVSQLTPPYTPQHNGVSKRRIRTLLNMVRSMMDLTNLPKSFWGYALESTVRILNMVPTKKVERTPHEIWHGRAPNLIPKGNEGLLLLLSTREQDFCCSNTKFFENNLMVQEASILSMEMKSMKDNQVWNLVKLPSSGRTVRQASRSWNKRFDVEIKKIGFTQNPDEPCVYLKASGSSVAFLILYVDDILLMGNNVTMLQEVKSWLCKCFSMKDLGEAAYILGIKII